ncbi:acyl-CoA/acyl-ACP dehydrogenase [Streptomyces sp. NBC_01387]|uniref:acyl-CoA dehydrogenase family protein n=1 Tax=unclassified Streptomyces TaxID=2593676 RepID=UPI0020258A46|nr:MULTISPECIES: acyl-CoA dehydrogenase family protein [unclassified Streptomyces]MCX4552799.1 acyl-CoA/acyl-ACP dehydrogenase [Streptomyces sp. NBC_01500]WSC24133.1 acyl-CoA/acyl-ACP dehydrogenase [Streptomyces sp. NBC_01766]WSV58020.1 acyl-CoA/acyl-ACP dehydrogenase [Streptomyces sp. NBC_01014]
MKFLLDDEQAEFGRTLDRMLTAADTPAAVRAWGDGDTGRGRALWARIAEAGVFALAVPEAQDGMGLLPVELAVSFVELGRHAVPGPLVESVAAGVLLGGLAERGDTAAADAWLPRIASGQAMVSLALAEGGPYALDADAADVTFVVTGADAPGTAELRTTAGHGPVQPSLDPARRLARPLPGTGATLAISPAVEAAATAAADWAAFATAAQTLGVGLALVERTVAYAKQRTQFSTTIGAFQAVKHRLADALIGLEFARPLVHGAAVALSGKSADAGAEIAAAKVAAGEAAYAAARTALQLHGAIGYTAEYDLSLWIRKARALRSAWGTPSACRARVLAGPVAPSPGVSPATGPAQVP